MTPDLQIRKHLAVKSSAEEESSASNDITTEPPPRPSQPTNRLSANRLNDILGIVQNAQNEVQNALKFRSNGGIRNAPSPSCLSPAPTTPSSSTPNRDYQSKSSEKRKQLSEKEMFAYSSEEEDEEGGEGEVGPADFKSKSILKMGQGQPSATENDPDSDLEKTLDNWLTKHNNQQRRKEREVKMSSSRGRGGGEGFNQEQREEEEDDGGVADLQCLLADVLMSSGEKHQKETIDQDQNSRNRFNIL